MTHCVEFRCPTCKPQNCQRETFAEIQKQSGLLIGLLGADPPDLTLKSASPSPSRGSIWHRFDIDSTISWFDPISVPNRPLRREGEADSRVGSGGPVPNKPLTSLGTVKFHFLRKEGQSNFTEISWHFSQRSPQGKFRSSKSATHAQMRIVKSWLNEIGVEQVQCLPRNSPYERTEKRRSRLSGDRGFMMCFASIGVRQP